MKTKRTTQSAIGGLCAPIWLALVCVFVTSVYADVITVTNTGDSGPGSLRQALAAANDGDTITFTVTGTITLNSGGLLIAKNITISGPGSNHLSIDGNQAVLVFGILPGKTVTIFGLTIRNAQAGAGVWNEQGTVAVSNCVVTSNSYDGLYNHQGTLNVNNCVLRGNSYYGLYAFNGVTTVSNGVVTGNASGGLVNDGPHGGPPPPPNHPIGGPGSMTIADSMISDNSGPGVSNFTGFLTVLNSTLSGNSAGQSSDGGGILSGTFFKAPAEVTVMNSTISGNSAPDLGGGIAGGYSGVAIVNSTISRNSAGNSGGAIATKAALITNSTISGNSATSGGGIYSFGNLEISNTILNAGASGENIFNNGGTVTSHGYNISSDNGSGYLNGPGDQINTDPLLGPLQDNGGPTLTHMLLPGSPAIDAGDPNFTPPPFHDQRGPCFYRVFGRPHWRIDVGSVEVQPGPRCPTPAPRPTPPQRP
jgi:predicted outer membrane repeat protein